MTDDIAWVLWLLLAVALIYWVLTVFQIPLAWPWEPIR